MGISIVAKWSATRASRRQVSSGVSCTSAQGYLVLGRAAKLLEVLGFDDLVRFRRFYQEFGDVLLTTCASNTGVVGSAKRDLLCHRRQRGLEVFELDLSVVPRPVQQQASETSEGP